MAAGERMAAERIVILKRGRPVRQEHDEIVDQTTVTVRIPERNVLDIETLQGLMEQSGTGEI